MYERDEFLRDRIRPHQPGTPRGYSPRPPSGDRCPAPPPGRHAAAATPPGPPRLPSAPLRPLPDPAWPRQPEAPPPSTWADPALAPIRSRTRPGERGWRRMVRLVTFGLVGLGRSGMQRQEAQFEATIRTVLHGNHKVAVLGKGGVGKTSVAACVGSILAELRQQDRIVGIDADTAFGRLSSRIDPRAAGSFWELTTDTNLRSFTDITARLGRNSAGLYVLAGQPASGPRRVLDPAIYREAALRLDHHFAISVIDCGSSMEAAVTQEVLRDVDALIVVSSPWADGASAAANTIEWLSDYGLTGLLRRPAHSPSAPADSTASRAHSHRRGQARHRVLASSSGVVVQRSGSCVQTPSGTSYRAVTVMSTFLQKALQVVASAAKAYRINHSDATVSSSACLAVLRLRFGELRV